jgi:hypothetical protein
MKALMVLLLALPLLSFNPPVSPLKGGEHAVHWTRIAVQTSAPLVQPCSFETATARLEQQISDPAGIPFGLVRAWSCSGDVRSVIAELQSRQSAMEVEAANYRAAHPLHSPPARGSERGSP